MVGGSRNAWDEHALALARDEGFVSTATERRVWAVCTEVLGELSAFERDLLLRMTEEYRQQWDADRSEPDDATARTWLVQDLERALSKQAMDHGFRLVRTATTTDGRCYPPGAEPWWIIPLRRPTWKRDRV